MSYRVGPLFRRMCSSIGVSFVRISPTLPTDEICIGIGILPFSEVRAPRRLRGAGSNLALSEEEDWEVIVPALAHARVGAAPFVLGRAMDVEDLESCIPFFVVGFGHDPRQAARCRPRAASFAEGRTGYLEWARRSGRLADIHSLDDRLDHDIDEFMALRPMFHRAEVL